MFRKVFIPTHPAGNTAQDIPACTEVGPRPHGHWVDVEDAITVVATRANESSYYTDGAAANLKEKERCQNELGYGQHIWYPQIPGYSPKWPVLPPGSTEARDKRLAEYLDYCRAMLGRLWHDLNQDPDDRRDLDGLAIEILYDCHNGYTPEIASKTSFANHMIFHLRSWSQRVRARAVTPEAYHDTDADRVETQEFVEELLEALTPVEKAIVVQHFGLDGGFVKTLQQLATTMPFTEDQLSRLYQGALRKMGKKH